MSAAPVVVAEGLGKVFRPPASLGEMLRGRFFGHPTTALSQVSFSIAPGEIVCVMGPNGAGKSTLVRILGGLLLPSSGTARVCGVDAGTGGSAFRRRVAFVVGDERSFHFRVSGRANLHYFGALHGLPAGEARRRASGLLERVGLHDAANRPYREYSRGMRQRLALARGLLADPEVILLDEPTLGLDPRGARDMRQFLRDEVIRKPGRTAIVCSNDPSEVRALADRVLFLEAGRLHGDAPPERIEAELGL
ncbi:MAG TPA: ABC transporter ATP-binding protein [Polyangia bacterium]|nr:ABC transporter ATP-binding protein [Polyangia bacterium]